MKLRFLRTLADTVELCFKAKGDLALADQQCIDMLKGEVIEIETFLKQVKDNAKLLGAYFAHIQRCGIKIEKWQGQIMKTAINAEATALSVEAMIDYALEEEPASEADLCDGQTGTGAVPKA